MKSIYNIFFRPTLKNAVFVLLLVFPYFVRLFLIEQNTYTNNDSFGPIAL